MIAATAKVGRDPKEAVNRMMSSLLDNRVMWRID